MSWRIEIGKYLQAHIEARVWPMNSAPSVFLKDGMWAEAACKPGGRSDDISYGRYGNKFRVIHLISYSRTWSSDRLNCTRNQAVSTDEFWWLEIREKKINQRHNTVIMIFVGSKDIKGKEKIMQGNFQGGLLSRSSGNLPKTQIYPTFLHGATC